MSIILTVVAFALVLVGLFSAWVTAEQIGQLDIRRKNEWEHPGQIDAGAAGRYASKIRTLAVWTLVASIVTLVAGFTVAATTAPLLLVLFGILTILTAGVAMVLALMCVARYPQSWSTWVTTALYFVASFVTLWSLWVSLTPTQ